MSEIFPVTGNADRGRELQGTWRAFGEEMAGPVQSALDRGRSPPEIAYALGELVHNFFRTRGVTLTSYELRRLVAELLDRQRPARAPEPEPEQEGPAESAPQPAPARDGEAMVRFDGEPVTAPWTGDDPPPPATPYIPEAVFEAPPSPVVVVRPLAAAVFDRLRTQVTERVRGQLSSWQRETVVQTIADVVDQLAEPLDVSTRQRLAAEVLSELVGLGPIDRLWADRSVQAVFVNGPRAVFVERNGRIERATEAFRDEAHLASLLGRLAVRPANLVAEFELRDGSSGTIVFPPAAPAGPILALRRSEPGTTTFDRLLRLGALSSAMADLLRLAARGGLNMVVSGPAGSGKTALLAAVARDLDGVARVVTVARHRQFRWVAPTKVELVVSAAASYPPVLSAARRLQPSLLVLDSLERGETRLLRERLLQGERGTLAAVVPEILTAELARSVDLAVHLAGDQDGLPRIAAMVDGRGRPLFAYEAGVFQRKASAPSFAALLEARGYGEPLARLFR